jgi:hypothetical protein
MSYICFTQNGGEIYATNKKGKKKSGISVRK